VTERTQLASIIKICSLEVVKKRVPTGLGVGSGVRLDNSGALARGVAEEARLFVDVGLVG